VRATYFERFVSTVTSRIDLAVRDAHLEAVAGRARVRLRRVDDGWTPRSWPALATVRLSDADHTALSKVAHAAGSSPHSPVLSGLRLGGGWAVASDGYRLARASFEAAIPPCLPPAHLTTRLLADADSSVDIASDGRSVVFEADGVTWLTPSIEGEYFAWETVIPSTTSTPERLEADRDGLLDAVRRVERVGFANSGAGFTRLVLERQGEGGVVVRADDAEVGDVRVEVDGELTMAAMAFNASYLSRVLEQTEGPVVVGRCAGPTKALVIEDDASLQLVMPLRS
jgi:DNA polymerase III sliding clamp (beta) subunit (PCNA family)